MEKKELPLEMTEVFSSGHFAYLCTTDQSNQPHITPMFFVFDEKNNSVKLMTSSDSKKLKNLLFNSEVSLSIDIRDPKNPFNNRGVMVQGKAIVAKCFKSTVTSDDEEVTMACEGFQRKYPVLSAEAKFPISADYEKVSEDLIRIIPKKMTYWRGPRFITVTFKQGTLWKIEYIN